ncbi:1002_t:CDS:1, partial [Rhizophagus irregularis]
MRLESSKGHAEAAFEEAKQALFEECNIILSNISTFDPSIEE